MFEKFFNVREYERQRLQIIISRSMGIEDRDKSQRAESARGKGSSIEI